MNSLRRKRQLKSAGVINKGREEARNRACIHFVFIYPFVPNKLY